MNELILRSISSLQTDSECNLLVLGLTRPFSLILTDGEFAYGFSVA